MNVNVKQIALELGKRLSEDCNWDDLMYEIYVRQKIQAGLDDCEAGRVISHEEVFREYGL